jgi:hypothetical protein
MVMLHLLYQKLSLTLYRYIFISYHTMICNRLALVVSVRFELPITGPNCG